MFHYAGREGKLGAPVLPVHGRAPTLRSGNLGCHTAMPFWQMDWGRVPVSAWVMLSASVILSYKTSSLTLVVSACEPACWIECSQDRCSTSWALPGLSSAPHSHSWISLLLHVTILCWLFMSWWPLNWFLLNLPFQVSIHIFPFQSTQLSVPLKPSSYSCLMVAMTWQLPFLRPSAAPSRTEAGFLLLWA